MELTNVKMTNYLESLYRISSKAKGKLGYAVARNIRKISDELVEYENLKNEYIRKHGEKTDNGDYVIHKDTDAFVSFLKDMQEFAFISHDVDIYMVNVEDIENSDLTADEILNIEFMITE